MKINYREATKADAPEMGRIRALEWETEEYWVRRISGYMNKELHPQKALMARIVFVAQDSEQVIGFAAGHLTTRFDCDGELEWISVVQKYQRSKIASELIRLMAKWFVEQKAIKICVDPGNDAARQFYRHHGAIDLDKHWMFWSDVRSIIRNG